MVGGAFWGGFLPLRFWSGELKRKPRRINNIWWSNRNLCRAGHGAVGHHDCIWCASSIKRVATDRNICLVVVAYLKPIFQSLKR